jgi:hypothetical protein
MARDRKNNPTRLLGKFLWIRDLALMCRFDLESNGGMITTEMRARAQEGLKLWEDTLDNHGDHPQVQRMVKDHLEFYSTLTNVLDTGFMFKIKLCSTPGLSDIQLNGAPELSARFLNKRHLDKFLSVIINGEVENYEHKYQ